jgi:DNA-binding response OmpR family regulator
MAPSAQVLVLSPDGSLRRTLSRWLSSLGHTPLLAPSVDEARRTLARVQIDLICLDGVLPDGEAERFWHWLRSLGARVPPSLVLLATATASAVPSALPPFFRPKQHGLVPRPLDSETLACEIARLLAARPRTEPAAAALRFGPLTLDGASHQLLSSRGGTVALTPIEFRLVRALMERSGELVSAEELVEEVWGYPEGFGGPELVRAHISNVRRKLRDQGIDPQLLRTVPYHGYGFVGLPAGRP